MLVFWIIKNTIGFLCDLYISYVVFVQFGRPADKIQASPDTLEDDGSSE